MRLTADLHIHSHYARATSKDLDFPHLAKWAQIKGVQIVGTGDIAHPGWLAEMHDCLEPAEPGLFRLKPELAKAVAAQVPAACRSTADRGEVRFLLAGEISSIYKKGGQTRKVHNVIFAPSLPAVAAIQARLERIGNIRSDGRPILGLPSRDLLEIILEVAPDCHLIPAHIWTPWFSLLGSKSGYDSVEECFEDLTPHIFALETGLSSDPPMNWRVSGLDRYTLVSHSDAHSPPKLAREATLFDCDLSYDAIFAALRSGDPAACRGTIEFFPEEGKYHHDGHRKCGVNWKPATTRAHSGLCAVCGKPVTVGVYHRVEELADRPEGQPKANALPFYSLIPLPEILGELLGVGAGSKKVEQEYDRLLAALGPELAILLELPLAEIAQTGGEKLAAGIGRMRRSEVSASAGYDGEYGVIKLFDRPDQADPQMMLFAMAMADAKQTLDAGGQTQDAHPTIVQRPLPSVPEPPASNHPQSSILDALNPAQRAAVLTTDRPLIIVAGPGAGKTRTLTARIAHLIDEKGVAPEAILAITFTNKAAGEMAERLRGMVGPEITGRITIQTFHAFGAHLLRRYADRLALDPAFVLLCDEERAALARAAFPDLNQREISHLLDLISAAKNDPDSPSAIDQARLAIYTAALAAAHALDFDDLIALPVQLLHTQPDVRAEVQARYRWISVDEYQDINAVQDRLLRLLTAGGANLCVIGDPDQAIYGFRGADYRYFLHFAQAFPGAARLQLSQNYRSTQMILDAATQVIARNPDRAAAELFSEFVDDVKLDVHPAPTDKAEAEFIVHQIEQMVGGTSYFSLDSGRVADDTRPVEYAFGDFAVLYRLNALARPLIAALERSGIPYQTVGQTPFFARPAVQIALAGMWLLHNPDSTIHRQRFGERLPLAAAPGASVREIAEWAGQAAGLDEETRRQLAARAQPFGSDLRAFLEMTALGSEADFYDPRADRVTLMTLHAAKGLEFPVVFIAGCEEGLLPYERAGEQPDVAEERRLFYVGMTRAQRKLVLSHARRRFLFGQFRENPRSRFIADIETALLELQKRVGSKRKRSEPQAQQLSLF